MELINISQAFDNSGHNGSGKDFTDLRQSDQSRIDYVIAASVVVSVLLCFTALFGNCSILITLWRTPSLHSVANILLASLALSDLAVGVIVQPLYITLPRLDHKSMGKKTRYVTYSPRTRLNKRYLCIFYAAVISLIYVCILVRI